ncbi:hypothetical protein AVEN_23278-1 [Araneus ventricosus]|uniref:DDE Tnp4 domain-containing protein n=1 Tax=Araneus ventricosus TaxID=182803 RepID=A0A4Y2Q8G0_ARAVE|nr:hypothetical protein AVEN_23278-1 [Araneus ventricosus]
MSFIQNAALCLMSLRQPNQLDGHGTKVAQSFLQSSESTIADNQLSQSISAECWQNMKGRKSTKYLIGQVFDKLEDLSIKFGSESLLKPLSTLQFRENLLNVTAGLATDTMSSIVEMNLHKLNIQHFGLFKPHKKFKRAAGSPSLGYSVISCAELDFGTLNNNWFVFLWPISIDTDFTVDIVEACIVLHNFVHDQDWFSPEDTTTAIGLQDLPGESMARGVLQANTVRNMLSKYFVSSVGAFPWQKSKI